MIPKIIGATLIVTVCGGAGMAMAQTHRKKERLLLQLIHALQAMSSELQYRLTPLPQLLCLAGEQTGGMLARIFRNASREMELQGAPDAAGCLDKALRREQDLPSAIREKLLLMGKGLGRYDLQGQLSGLEAVSQLCKRDLEGLQLNRDARLRSYTTLGFCGGVALVILFI